MRLDFGWRFLIGQCSAECIGLPVLVVNKARYKKDLIKLQSLSIVPINKIYYHNST